MGKVIGFIPGPVKDPKSAKDQAPNAGKDQAPNAGKDQVPNAGKAEK